MRKTVLVIEDDPGIQETLEMALDMEGYEPIIARDGIEALSQLDHTKPVLILLDLMMPRMNGYEFIEALRQRDMFPGIPIIIVTADGRARYKAEQAGAEGYIIKPFELSTLLDEIKRLAQDDFYSPAG